MRMTQPASTRARRRRARSPLALLTLTLMLGLLPMVPAIAAAEPTTSTHIVVDGTGEPGDDWNTVTIVALSRTEVGPVTPPYGRGSYMMQTDPAAVNVGYANIWRQAVTQPALASISAISYFTYDIAADACESPVVSLRIDLNGDADTDDALHFMPCEQSGAPLPDGVSAQPTPVLNSWQQWHARDGVWTNTERTVRTTLDAYITAHPSARLALIGYSVGIGLSDGFFDGGLGDIVGFGGVHTYIDGVAVTIDGHETIYDFEPTDITAPQVTNLTATPNPAIAPASVTVTATVHDGNPLASGVYTTGSGAPRSLTPVDGMWDESTEEVALTLSNLSARTHTICIRATDIGNNTSANACTPITISAAPPTDTSAPVLSNLTSTPNPARINQSIRIAVTADDTTTGNATIISAQYRINSGSWQALLPADGQWNQSIELAEKAVSFSTPGDNTVCVRATDRYGNQSAEQCSTLTVINSASRVTGSGQFASPRNAVTSRPTYTGRASVGVQAAYPATQSTAPTGSFSLTLAGTAFSFQSSTLTSLITSSAGVGELRGSGKLNGSAGYSFSVTFDDHGTGTQDRIRARIWNTSTSAIVYDSQPGAATTAALTIRLTSGNLTVTP